MKLNDMERLAVATALEKACKAVTDPRPRHGETLRTKADDSLRELFASTGCDRVRINIGGADVGTFSLTFTLPKSGVELRVRDARELAEWLRCTDEGLDVTKLIVNDIKVQAAILDAAKEYGFMPDGCYMAEVEEPARIKGTTLRVDAEKVARALGDELPQAVAGLIGGEVE